MSRVEVVDYDPHWPVHFVTLRDVIARAVGERALAIEHVGSTAVPGLAAKPVIDVDVVVRADEVAAGIERLAAIGYVHRGDLGIPGREAFRAPTGTVRHHLYLCPESSIALRNHLAVRDYVRTHAAAAEAYGSLKRRLARTFAEDIDGYVDGKTAFLIDVLRTSGFSTHELDAIATVNRTDLPT